MTDLMLPLTVTQIAVIERAVRNEITRLREDTSVEPSIRAIECATLQRVLEKLGL